MLFRACFLNNTTFIISKLRVLRSESPQTQFQAFKNIARLSTEYPGLRRVLIDCENVKHAGGGPSAPSAADISGLWCPYDHVRAPEWMFYLNLAATCLADENVAQIIEDNLPGRIFCVDSAEGLSVTERLLVVSDCEYDTTLLFFTLELM